MKIQKDMKKIKDLKNVNFQDYMLLIWRKIGKAEKAALLSGMVVGILTHLFMITNKIPNWDDVSVVPTTGLGPFAGRWMGDKSAHWFSQWSAPGLNGVMAVVFLAIAAAFVVRILCIQSVTGGVLAAAAIVTFPSIASNMTFMYASPTYSLAILLMAVSVWLTRRFRFGWIPAVYFMMISMAIYQAYFSFAVALFVLALILDLIDHPEITTKKALFRSGKHLLVLIGGLLAYFLSVRHSGYEMVDYRGITNIGQESPITYVHAIARAYHRVLQYFITSPESYGTGAVHRWHIVICLLIVFLLVFFFAEKKIWKQPGKALGYWILAFLMPLAAGLVYVMAPEEDHATTVMIFSYCIVYLMLLALAERIGRENLIRQGLAVLCSVSVLSACWCNYVRTNKAYYRIYIANERVYSFCTRLITRLEEAGYTTGDPVIIMGDFDPSWLSQRDMDGYLIEDWEGMPYESGLLSRSVRPAYIMQILGVEIGYYDESKAAELEENSEYQAMPEYPAEGSIQNIDGTWVVKFPTASEDTDS